MSLRNRARALQKKTGLGYQQSLARLRGLGERPAALSRETGWPLAVCDRYLVDGRAPIDVIEVARPGGPTLHDRVVEVCERLRAMAAARSVIVTAAGGRLVAHVGERDVAAFAPAMPRPAAARAFPDFPEVMELGEGIVLYHARMERGIVRVRFHRDETSLGLVRLRARQAIEELERLLAEPEASGTPPSSGSSGPGGLPAQVRVAKPKR